MASKNEATTIIGDGSVFEGNFFIKGPLEIKGKFQGQIKGDDHIVISPTGKVKTNIHSKKVTVAGTLIGDIKAEEEAVLMATGRILGNVKAPRVQVENGMVIKGGIEITGHQVKNIDKHVKDEFNSTPGFDSLSNGEDKPKNKLLFEKKK